MFFFQELLAIFTSTLLPVFLIAGAGYVLARFVSLDVRTLGRFLYYLATPSLVFRSLYRMQSDLAALGHLAVIAIGVMTVGLTLGWLAGRDQDRRRRAGIMLGSAISNNGNMGIPISLFAFGEAGQALATVYFAIASLLSNTVGVLVASSGSLSPANALAATVRAPVLYAATLGLIFNQTGFPVPQPVFSALDLLAGAAVPGMLVLLGIQLRSTQFAGSQRLAWRSVAVRLAVSPLVAAAIALLLGLGGVERDVAILQAAMPTAVMTTVLATEFSAAPHLVSAIVLFSTLGSMVSLSIVLALLR
ncbi:MAG: AEC family transporter [Anaerolineales bacterium]|nr:AEC family transporter [Anaerolineales bacterium]